MIAPVLVDVPAVTFDNVIYQVQSARGATMYWRRLLSELGGRDDIRVVEREARTKFDRYMPLLRAKGTVHTSLFRWPLPTNHCRLVVTAHDLAYERGLIKSRRATVGRLERRLAIQRASGIICVSDATKDDLRDFYGPMISGVPVTVAHHGPSVPIVERHGVEVHNPSARRLLLHVGHRDSYKNFIAITEALRTSPQLANEVSVLVVGPPPRVHERSITSIDASNSRWELPSRSGIFYLGRVSNQELSGLYQTVDGVVCPSRFEGFGFPVLDALHHGCRVWCSRIPPHIEIAGESAVYFDPEEPESLAAALKESVAMTPSIVDAINNRFNWSRSASSHIQLYQALAVTGNPS